MSKYKDDSKFQEFLRIHKRNSTGIWDNDAILEAGKAFQEDKGQEESEDEEEKEVEKEEEEDSEEEETKNKEEISDLDYLKSKKKTEKEKKEPKNEEYYTVKLSGLPYKIKKKDIKQFFKPLKPKSIRVPRKIGGIAYVGFANETDGKKSLAKSKTFIKGHQIYVKHFTGKSKLREEEENKWKEQEEGLKKEEGIAESGRIFIRNLSYAVTEDDLKVLFEPFGPLTEINLPIDRLTKKIKGFGFVTFVMPENAVKAFAELDGKSLQGRLLHLIPGKARLEDQEDEDNMTYKQKKAKKVKAQAGSSHNWNTLFLGSSAVADVMADKYNVNKSDVLLAEGKQSAAVRLALGETEIVSETKKFLEDQGVCLDVFSRPPTERSKSVILIKNLPMQTAVEEIRDKFSKFGDLARVVLPPYGVTALVEFYEVSEARTAFKSLAYTRFKNTPLYLEWAPENVMTSAPVKSETEKEEEIDVAEQNATLFVKNINFSTTEESLKKHFEQSGQVLSASISKKRDLQRGEMLSMGYGFVQFAKAAEASKALKTLQHSRLDEHCLELKRSTRTLTSETDNQAMKRKHTQMTEEKLKQGSTKLLVRNVPFQANVREIEEIFKTFGILKSVRLPKKVTGSHRGFAFVEFQTKSDAKKAFESLCQSTHLYGRRLVLEWAEEEETIDDLRKKTASQFVDGPTKAKKVKKADIMQSVIMGN